MPKTEARYDLVGCALNLVGTIVTMAYHVPHNDALAKVDPASTTAITAWRSYLSPWLAWNHVRTVASLGSVVAFVLALRVD